MRFGSLGRKRPSSIAKPGPAGADDRWFDTDRSTKLNRNTSASVVPGSFSRRIHEDTKGFFARERNRNRSMDARLDACDLACASAMGGVLPATRPNRHPGLHMA